MNWQKHVIDWLAGVWIGPPLIFRRGTKGELLLVGQWMALPYLSWWTDIYHCTSSNPTESTMFDLKNCCNFSGKCRLLTQSGREAVSCTCKVNQVVWIICWNLMAVIGAWHFVKGLKACCGCWWTRPLSIKTTLNVSVQLIMVVLWHEKCM